MHIVRGVVTIEHRRTLRGWSGYTGSYSADFKPLLGYSLRDRNTEVSITTYAADSVLIVFSPAGGSNSITADDGAIAATGAARGDSIAGSWEQQTYGGGVTGDFRLRRRR